MSQFQCPLCGKYNSYVRYDPSGFDDDIYGVDVSGRGRGLGFSFSEKYSLLYDEHLVGLITKRCHRIILFIEGVEVPKPGEVAELRKIIKEWVVWGADAEKRLAEKDSQIERLFGQHASLEKRVLGLSSEQSALLAENEEFRRAIEQWRTAYQNLMSDAASKDRQIQGYMLQNQQLRNKVKAYLDANDEDDSAAAAEMEDLLNRINESSDTDYDNLSDAIDFLLE